jgi:hypothetical protein
VLKRHLRRLSGLPAWGGSAFFGTWLSLQFGEPRLEIREPVANAGRFGRRRRASVVGQHHLWLDMCHWEIFEDSRRRFHSGQSRLLLLRAAAHLEGQILVGVSLSLRPLLTEFEFDGGSRLVARRYPRAASDWELWHLYSPRSYLGLTSDARIHWGWLRPERLRAARLLATQIAV